ncbi:minor tail protein [Arthrobacter phage Giantsbane]|nr:minor tail protein [Arthrobacter phage Giantsbane]
MTYKPVGIDENGKFPPRVERAIVNTIADPNGYDVIILAGQSNMSGRGTGFTAKTDPPHPKIFQLKGKTPNKGTIVPATEPLDMVDTPSGVGPGFQFARWYVSEGLNQGRKVLLVPVAQGGTPITRVATPTWKPSVSGSLYDNLLSQAKIAQDIPGARIIAALWLQGETDGDLNATGPAYQTEFDAIITGLRNHLGLPNLPFILAGMVPEYLSTGTRTAIDAVHKDTPNRLDSVGFATSPTGMNKGDGNHFDLNGSRVIAKSMFDSFTKVSSGLPATAAVTTPAVITATRGTLWTPSLPSYAYSLRLVVPGYTGKLVRVRRSSDNTETDIAALATGRLDEAALLAFAGAGDAFIAKWYDQTSAALHVAQTVQTAQPKIVAAGVIVKSGNRPAASFDGVDDVLFHNSPKQWLAGSASTAVVLSAPTAAPKRWYTESHKPGGSQYSLLQPDHASGKAIPVRNYSAPTGIDGTAAAAQALNIAFDGTIKQMTSFDIGGYVSQWVDGLFDLDMFAYGRSVGFVPDTFALGGVIRDTGSLAPLAMTFSEAIFWPSVLTDSERRAITESQIQYYSIT